MLQIGFFSSSGVFSTFFSPSARPPSAPLFGRVVDWMTRRLSACRQIFLMIFVQAMLRSIWARCLRVSVFVSMCVRGFFYAPVSAKLIIYICISGSSRVSVKASSQQQQMLDKIFPIMRSILRFHSAFALQSSSSSSSSSSLPVISYIT